MKIVFPILFCLKSIAVFAGAVMLFSCKNDLSEVSKVAGNEEVQPEMSGENMVMVYSDSAKIKYKVTTPEYLKVTRGKEIYEEFPKGIHVISYDASEQEMGSIRSKYAKKLENEMLWEARNEVVIVNAEGKKLETELLYWDTAKGIIYSDRYVRLTSDGQIIEGNNGFQSDQNLEHPVFYSITGKVEVEKKKEQ